MIRVAVVLLVGVIAAGCESAVCTLEARSAFGITVTDSITGANLAPTATVRVTEGSFSDTLVAFPAPPASNAIYSGLYERAGVYEVTVTHPAYLTWRRTNVRVSDGICHVEPQVFTVRLRKP